jgi:type III pantothenate kinase
LPSILAEVEARFNQHLASLQIIHCSLLRLPLAGGTILFMILSIDIGNSNIVIGIYDIDAADHLPVANWRLATERQRTADEYRLVLRQLLAEAGFSSNDLEDAALCSVVAPLTHVWVQLLSDLLGKAPLVVRYGLKLGIEVAVNRPEVIGTDRLVDAVAAYSRTQGAVVVVDFGTATTFNVINSQGIFLGGAIAPGLGTITRALIDQASALPAVELTAPLQTIGRDTIPAIQSGLVYGYVGLVEGLLSRIRAEVAEPVTVFATGGLGGVIAPLTEAIDVYDPWLTLAGIVEVYRRNRRNE